MIASILRIPADTPAASPEALEQFARTPGVVSFYMLTPGEGIGDRLAVVFWATEQALDAYIDSDAGQQVLRDNPQATRTIYVVTQVK